MVKSPRVVSNLTWKVSGAFSLSMVGRSKVRSKLAAADFPAAPALGPAGFGFSGACAGVCASAWKASANETTKINITDFLIAIPSLLLNSSYKTLNLFPRLLEQLPADALHFSHYAQSILAENLLHVTFGISLP